MSFLKFFKKQIRPQPETMETGGAVAGQPDQTLCPGGPEAASAPSPIPLPEEGGAGAGNPPDPGSGAAPALSEPEATPCLAEALVAGPAPKPLVKKVYFLGGSHEKLNQRLKDELKKLGFSWIDLSSTYMEQALDEIMKNNPEIFFCVVTLSGDEFVYEKNGKPAQARVASRQDVVFKLGYLIGRHGKSNCFVLYKEQKSFVLPTSLIHGIFTVLDDDIRWKDMLKSRLVGSGYTLS
jgi:hypothetical protein